MRKKVCGIYKIENIITGDFYIGSSKNVKLRWKQHKRPSVWKVCPNSQMYKDMQKYGVENFQFTILSELEPEHLKETEQEFIEMLQPTYNSNRAKGLDYERQKKIILKYQKKYQQSNKGRETSRKATRKYYSMQCNYNGEIIRFSTLSMRFLRAGIEHPNIEARKYLIEKN